MTYCYMRERILEPGERISTQELAWEVEGVRARSTIALLVELHRNDHITREQMARWLPFKIDEVPSEDA